MASTDTVNPPIRHRYVEADGLEVFYREAGNPDAPVILLLHGFPSSSHMYRNLMAELRHGYRVIAPDLPGFGFTKVSSDRGYRFTFENLARTIGAFVEALGLERYALYVFDYGAPVGLRLAVAHPERVSALISQNGNAYLEGLGGAWDPIRRYWDDSTAANRDALREALSLEGTRWLYLHGVGEPELVAPESFTLDYMLMGRPGNDEIQLDLFLDYASNLAEYPKFQAFFREWQVPTLAIWGQNDPYFIPAGAAAFLRDNPNAVVEMLETGHFALETHADYIASRITQVLAGAID
jgi:pimeloyl-ACP methyl ester carboxylesterase